MHYEMAILGWMAASFIGACFAMKSVHRLRVFGILGNFSFLAYALVGMSNGMLEQVLPIFTLHIISLPLNVYHLRRLRQGETVVQDEWRALREAVAAKDVVMAHDILVELKEIFDAQIAADNQRGDAEFDKSMAFDNGKEARETA